VRKYFWDINNHFDEKGYNCLKNIDQSGVIIDMVTIQKLSHIYETKKE